LAPTSFPMDRSRTLGPSPWRPSPPTNLKRGPAPGKVFHDKGRGCGYIVTYAGKPGSIFQGDTEAIAESESAQEYSMSLRVVMNLPYTMTPEEGSRPGTRIPSGGCLSLSHQGFRYPCFQEGVGRLLCFDVRAGRLVRQLSRSGDQRSYRSII